MITVLDQHQLRPQSCRPPSTLPPCPLPVPPARPTLLTQSETQGCPLPFPSLNLTSLCPGLRWWIQSPTHPSGCPRKRWRRPARASCPVGDWSRCCSWSGIVCSDGSSESLSWTSLWLSSRPLPPPLLLRVRRLATSPLTSAWWPCFGAGRFGWEGPVKVRCQIGWRRLLLPAAP